MYLFCGCVAVNVEVNVSIWYDWLLLCLLYCLEIVRRVFWGLIFVAISSIPIHSCVTNVSDRTTAAFHEDKLICFIASYLIEEVYDSVRHQDGVPTPYGDIFHRVKTRKLESPLLISIGSKDNGAFVCGTLLFLGSSLLCTWKYCIILNLRCSLQWSVSPNILFLSLRMTETPPLTGKC